MYKLQEQSPESPKTGLARDHGGRISTLFLDTETVVQPEPFIEGLQLHPAVDVLDTRCRTTITVTCAPRPDLTTYGNLPAKLGVRGRWCARSAYPCLPVLDSAHPCLPVLARA